MHLRALTSPKRGASGAQTATDTGSSSWPLSPLPSPTLGTISLALGYSSWPKLLITCPFSQQFRVDRALPPPEHPLPLGLHTQEAEGMRDQEDPLGPSAHR